MEREALKRKNALECNKRARAKYGATYNKKKGLKYQGVRFKEEEVDEIDKFCNEHNVAKSDVFRTAILNHIRNN